MAGLRSNSCQKRRHIQDPLFRKINQRSTENSNPSTHFESEPESKERVISFPRRLGRVISHRRGASIHEITEKFFRLTDQVEVSERVNDLRADGSSRFGKVVELVDRFPVIESRS